MRQFARSLAVILFGLAVTVAPVESRAQQARSQPPRQQPVKRAAATSDAPARGPTDTRPANGTRPAAPQQPLVPAGFRLSPQEQAELDKVLQTWEQRSAGIETFKCRFNMWYYDQAAGNPAAGVQGAGGEILTTVGQGEIRYKAPDHAYYRVNYLEKYVPPLKVGEKGKFVKVDEGLDYWVCDGKSTYEFNHQGKEVIETKLSPELQGKAISDGPLPFVFGAKAEKLKQRYFIRLVTPPDLRDKQVWLEARPRWQQDAGNFLRADLILTKADFLPYAIQTYIPGSNQRRSYEFTKIVVNDPLSFLKGDFAAPRVPLNWKKVVNDPSAAPPSAPSKPGPVQPAEARRPAKSPAAPVRK